MPTVESLLASLAERGIWLEQEGSSVIARPRQKLTDEDRALIRACGRELLGCLRARQEEAEINRLAAADGWKPLPPADDAAWSILGVCRKLGVALRIDENGDLVVGKAGAKAGEPTQPWRALLAEIEANLAAVARLIESGWHLRADFPKGAAA